MPSIAWRSLARVVVADQGGPARPAPAVTVTTAGPPARGEQARDDSVRRTADLSHRGAVSGDPVAVTGTSSRALA